MREKPPQFSLMDEYSIGKKESVFDSSDTPAIIMFNPKYPHNVGTAVRACSCFGSSLLMFTGDRLLDELKSRQGKKGYRLPREERMKGYKDVKIFNDEYPFNRFSKDVVPVAIEVRANAEYLPNFVHPQNAVYVFGPEDGSIPQIYLKHCQRFVYIPSAHCLNLAAAINVVLYDRMTKSNFTAHNYIKMLKEV
jgi:tRNA(Leu) C34 or U34 (ribose-2'-O)-methylase TrmL